MSFLLLIEMYISVNNWLKTHNSVNIYIGLLLTGLSCHNSVNRQHKQLCCHNLVNIGLLLAELCCHNLVNDTEHIKHIINVFRHNSVIVLRCSKTYTLKKLSVSLQLSNVQIDCKSAIFCQNAIIGQRGNRYSVIVFTNSGVEMCGVFFIQISAVSVVLVNTYFSGEC